MIFFFRYPSAPSCHDEAFLLINQYDVSFFFFCCEEMGYYFFGSVGGRDPNLSFMGPDARMG